MIRWLVVQLRRRIAIKLSLTLVGFVAVTSIAVGLYLSRALEQFATESLEARLVLLARTVHEEARRLLLAGAPPAAAQAFAARVAGPSEARVTVIAPDGRVVADSSLRMEELGAMESHAARAEVAAALAGRVGRDLRPSATLGGGLLLYVAVPVRDGARVVGALRLAVPLSAVMASYALLDRVLLAAGLVALAAASGIGLFVARRVTRPVVEMQAIARQMSEGNFEVRAPARSPDEIGTLGRSLNAMAARLREKIEDLAREKAKATAILDGMAEGVIAVDGRDHIVLMNERARALFGVGAGRAEDRPLLEVIRNVDLHRLFRESRRGAEGAVVRREIALTVPAPRLLQVNAVPLRLAEGQVGVVIVLDDITELRRLEQVRTEFVANVSHELRTPLTAIHGYIEALLGGVLEDPEHARGFLETAFRHTERMGRLIDDLTDLSNIELGKISLHRVPVRLDAAVEAVLSIIRPRAQARQVELAATLPPGLPPVHADHDRLEQILVNLVDNAVKYTPAGGTVDVSALARGPVMEVVVADTGIGISPADLPRVTERFYRVDKARSRELGGTGLGLAIVKHLVLAHGGELRIESDLGRGTRVRFTLPTSGPGIGA